MSLVIKCEKDEAPGSGRDRKLSHAKSGDLLAMSLRSEIIDEFRPELRVAIKHTIDWLILFKLTLHKIGNILLIFVIANGEFGKAVVKFWGDAENASTHNEAFERGVSEAIKDLYKVALLTNVGLVQSVYYDCDPLVNRTRGFPEGF